MVLFVLKNFTKWNLGLLSNLPLVIFGSERVKMKGNLKCSSSNLFSPSGLQSKKQDTCISALLHRPYLLRLNCICNTDYYHVAWQALFRLRAVYLFSVVCRAKRKTRDTQMETGRKRETAHGLGLVVHVGRLGFKRVTVSCAELNSYKD